MTTEHFEDYLAEVHMEQYVGTGDNAQDDFEAWCADMDWDTVMSYADDWRDEQVAFVAEEVKAMLLSELNNK